MSEHTPGPWIFIPEDDEAYCAGHIERDGDRYLIAQIYTQQNGNRIANARLILAAPDMLEALKMAERFIDEPENRTGQELSIFREVIAKATGKHLD